MVYKVSEIGYNEYPCSRLLQKIIIRQVNRMDSCDSYGPWRYMNGRICGMKGGICGCGQLSVLF